MNGRSEGLNVKPVYSEILAETNLGALLNLLKFYESSLNYFLCLISNELTFLILIQFCC
jgi:hypothetical protein